MELYLDKYTIIDDNMSDEEKIISYFKCQFGDDFRLIQVASFNELDDFCIYNNFEKNFVLNTIKNNINNYKNKK